MSAFRLAQITIYNPEVAKQTHLIMIYHVFYYCFWHP